MQIISLQTPRFLVRNVQLSDLDDIFIIHSEEDVNRFLPYITWKTKGDAKEWFNRTQERKNNGSAIDCVVEDRTTHRVIGTLILFNFENEFLVQNTIKEKVEITIAETQEADSAEIGFVVGKLFWRQGVMGEVLKSFIPYCFKDLGLLQLKAKAESKNSASNQLLEKLGFSKLVSTMESNTTLAEEITLNHFALLKVSKND